MLAKVVQSGTHQVVHLPAHIHFDVDRVEIVQGQNGDVILRPMMPSEQYHDFLTLFEGFDDDFVQVLASREQAAPQEREAL